VRYAVLKHKDLAKLVDHVNTALKEGWQLQGGVSVGTERDPHWCDAMGHFYVQAVVQGEDGVAHSKEYEHG
jgi:hypothetical protein